jgi:hypothetical protein
MQDLTLVMKQKLLITKGQLSMVMGVNQHLVIYLEEENTKETVHQGCTET